MDKRTEDKIDSLKQRGFVECAEGIDLQGTTLKPDDIVIFPKQFGHSTSMIDWGKARIEKIYYEKRLKTDTNRLFPKAEASKYDYKYLLNTFGNRWTIKCYDEVIKLI